MGMDLTRLQLSDLDPVLALVQEAGRAILELYGTSRERSPVEWKADRTPLTRADQAAHQVLLQGLQELTPRVPVVSEEGDLGGWIGADAPSHEGPEKEWDEGNAGRRPPGRTVPLQVPHWMVDPLDGTKEFIKGTGEFTVNVALIQAGRPVLGVVHAPVLRRSWLGASDGALHVTETEIRALQVRRADPASLSVVASRDHAGPQVQTLLAALPGARTLSMGSSLKFCLIAQGEADLYLRDGPTMEWDTAAAQAVLEGAGGGVFTLDGRRLDYGKPHLRNPHFVAAGDPALQWRDLIPQAPSDG